MKWFDVPGIDYLQITKCGRVRTKTRQVPVRKNGRLFSKKINGCEFRVCIHSNGYRRIIVRDGGVRKALYIHRLIGLVFVPGFQSGFTINHINGDKLDNRPENLEWISNSDNVRHGNRTGLIGKATCENAPGAKLTNSQVLKIFSMLSNGAKNGSIQKTFGIEKTTLLSIKHGKTWTSNSKINEARNKFLKQWRKQ